ncbi:MAG: alpha/beta hydrolase [Chlamydiales bacterium]
MKKFVLFFVLSLSCLRGEGNEESVVCIHGFMTSARSMYPLKQALKDTEYSIYLWSYPSRRKTIEGSAQLLVCFLQDIACRKPGRTINFITHSIGALVLRAALNLPGCPQEAKMGRAALIAPPNKGSDLARRFSQVSLIRMAMGSKSGQQLMTYTEKDIICLGNFPECMKVLIIGGSEGSTLWFNRPNDTFLAIDEIGLNTPYYWKTYPVTHGKLLKFKAIHNLIRLFFCDPFWEKNYPSLVSNPGFQSSSDLSSPERGG